MQRCTMQHHPCNYHHLPELLLISAYLPILVTMAAAGHQTAKLISVNSSDDSFFSVLYSTGICTVPGYQIPCGEPKVMQKVYRKITQRSRETRYSWNQLYRLFAVKIGKFFLGDIGLRANLLVQNVIGILHLNDAGATPPAPAWCARSNGECMIEIKNTPEPKTHRRTCHVGNYIFKLSRTQSRFQHFIYSSWSRQTNAWKLFASKKRIQKYTKTFECFC